MRQFFGLDLCHLASFNISAYFNKMQSESADFASMPPPGDWDKTYVLHSILTHFANSLCDSMTSSVKPEVHNESSEEDRSM